MLSLVCVYMLLCVLCVMWLLLLCCVFCSVALYLLHPIPITRFRSFRTQPLGNLSAAVKLPIRQRFLGNPTLGKSLVRERNVMGTGCTLNFLPAYSGGRLGHGDCDTCLIDIPKRGFPVRRKLFQKMGRS